VNRLLLLFMLLLLCSMWYTQRLVVAKSISRQSLRPSEHGQHTDNSIGVDVNTICCSRCDVGRTE